VGEVSRVDGLAFEHRLWGLSESESAGSGLAARAPAKNGGGLAAGAPELLEGYRAMRESVGLDGTSPVDPYNLMVTRRWMMLVPRGRECWEGMSVNALGYAGALLARDGEELDRIRRAGPMRILTALAGR
jgi:ATP adenylyltransferase